MNAFASFLKKLYIDIELHMPDSTTDSPILRDTKTHWINRKNGENTVKVCKNSRDILKKIANLPI